MSSFRDWSGNTGMRAALGGVALALLLCAWTETVAGITNSANSADFAGEE